MPMQELRKFTGFNDTIPQTLRCSLVISFEEQGNEREVVLKIDARVISGTRPLMNMITWLHPDPVFYVRLTRPAAFLPVAILVYGSVSQRYLRRIEALGVEKNYNQYLT